MAAVTTCHGGGPAKSKRAQCRTRHMKQHGEVYDGRGLPENEFCDYDARPEVTKPRSIPTKDCVEMKLNKGKIYVAQEHEVIQTNFQETHWRGRSGQGHNNWTWGRR